VFENFKINFSLTVSTIALAMLMAMMIARAANSEWSGFPFVNGPVAKTTSI
jgi:hypothetical protein